jgi:hypothetical protein
MNSLHTHNRDSFTISLHTPSQWPSVTKPRNVRWWLREVRYSIPHRTKGASVVLPSTFVLASHSNQKSYEDPIHTHITTYLITLVAYIQNRNHQNGLWYADVTGMRMTLSQLMHCYSFMVSGHLVYVKLKWLSIRNAKWCKENFCDNLMNCFLRNSSFVNNVIQLYSIRIVSLNLRHKIRLTAELYLITIYIYIYIYKNLFQEEIKR